MATIATLMVDVLANTATIERNTKTINSTLDSISSMAKTVGTALSAAFAVDKILQAGNQVLDFADSLSNLSAKTGIGTTGLQKLGLAFESSGISMDAVAGNVTKLAMNLVGGNKGAVDALEKMGLSLKTLKTLAPEDQFITVADAIGKIPNPTEKAYAAMTIFGKGGAELLQGLDGHLRETTDSFEKMGLIIDDQTIAAADAFGDQLGLMGKQLLGIVANIVGPLLPALSGLANILVSVANVVGKVTAFFIDWIQKGIVGAYSAILKFLATIADAATKIPFLGKYLGVAGDAADYLRGKAADADKYLVGLFTTTDTVAKSAKVATPPMLGLGDATEKTRKSALGAADAFDVMLKATQKFLGESLASTKTFIENFGMDMNGTLFANTGGNAAWQSMIGKLVAWPTDVAAQTIEHAKSFGQTLSAGISGAFSSIGPAIMGALQGGGNVLASVGAAMGGQLTQNIFGAKAMQKGITDIFGSTLGGAFNAMLPGIGALVGPLVSKISSFFAGVFGGPDAAEKAGRAVSDAFAQSMASSLDWMQQIEVHQLVAQGNSQKWAETVVGVRDAYVKAGHSVDEALSIVDRLFKAEKQGGDAVQMVIDEITMSMHDGVTPALNEMGTVGAGAFDGIADAAANAAAAAQSAANSAYNAWARTYNYMKAGGSDVDPTRGALSPENYSSFGDWMSAYLHFNEGATHGQIAAAWRSNSVTPAWADEAIAEGYAGGTGGLMDFGAGRPVMLHHKEEVRTEAQVRSDNGLLEELRGLRSDLKLLPRSMRDAVLLKK